LGEAAVLNAARPTEGCIAPELLIQRIADRLATHVGTVPLRDDCTIVAVDRT
jgi:hypothetical protein